MDGKKKFFERGWFTALMLFVFFPVGAFLLWKYHRKHKILNVLITLVSGFIFLIMMVAVFTPSEALEERSRQDQKERDEASQQLQMQQNDTLSAVGISNAEPAQSSPVTVDTEATINTEETSNIGNIENTFETTQQKTPNESDLPEIEQTHNDSAPISHNINSDTPDFTPSTSNEQQTLNESENEIFASYDTTNGNKKIAVNGDTITYTNDGFILTLPYNASLQSTILTEPINQFSISEGSNVPSEKIYEITISGLFYPVKLHIFENEGYNFNEDNRITVPNADGAYLAKNVSDSILEESSYELEVIRGDLLYVISATYWPSWALTGQAQGQSDFSAEREAVSKYLSDIEMIIDNFSLTDTPVPFDVIGAERQSYIILRDVAE